MIQNPKAKVLAFHRTTGQRYLGGAATLTAEWKKDNGARQPLTDLNPVEDEKGFYYFDLTTEERSVQFLGELFPQCSDSAIEVIPLPPNYYPTPSTSVTAPRIKFDRLPSPLFIGDDYLVADDRHIDVNVACAFTPSTCFLGFDNMEPIEGEVVGYANGVALCRFQIARALSEGRKPGPSDYSIEVRGSNASENTVAHSQMIGHRVDWLKKYT